MIYMYIKILYIASSLSVSVTSSLSPLTVIEILYGTRYTVNHGGLGHQRVLDQTRLQPVLHRTQVGVVGHQ